MIVIPGLSTAQSLERSVVASSGDFFSTTGAQLSWTLGQPTAVETFTNSTGTLTQGFHQSDFSTSIIEDLPISLTLTVFPNPSTGEFNFKMNAFEDGAVQMQIFDLSGRLVLQEDPSYSLGGIWNHQINLNHLPVGIYQCRVLFISDKGHSAVKTIKLSVIK